MSPRHDQFHVAQRLEVVDRARVGNDQIGVLTGLDSAGDIIDTLVYRLGLINQQYSLSAAVGLLKSVVSCILVLTGYKLADKYAGYKVW